MLVTLDLGNGPCRFFNGTPHPINLIAGAEYQSAVRKHTGGHEIAVIPPSGMLLSAELRTLPVVELGQGVTVARQVAVACDPMPETARAADYVIVSAIYALAYRQMFPGDSVKLVTPRDLVVASIEKPIPVGCLGFALV